MKKLIPFCLSLISFAAQAQTTISKTLVNGGLTREYRIYIPAVYNSNTAVPLVFNFHGYTSNNMAQEVYGDFRPIADTANFIVVHPQGTVILGSTAWNTFDLASTPDDVSFVSDMIDSLKANYNIDLNRVYATGLSNGGFMSYDLACKLNSRIAAIASVTGSMIPSHFASCSPLRPTPIMEIHGDADAVVPYSGTGGLIPFTHIDSLVKKWVTQNNCNPTPIMNQVANINTTDGCTAEHYEYTNGNNGSTVEFYKILGGGHTWPGTSIMIPSNGNTNMDFNASKEIWRFFRKFNLASLSTKIEEINSKLDIIVYPNPASGYIHVTHSYQGTVNMEIRNTMGQILMQKELSSYEKSIDISSLSSGIYFATFYKEGKGHKVFKLMVE